MKICKLLIINLLWLCCLKPSEVMLIGSESAICSINRTMRWLAEYIPSRGVSVHSVCYFDRNLAIDADCKIVCFGTLWWVYGNTMPLLKPQDNIIRMTMSVFESTVIPEEWVWCLNTYFDCVVVHDVNLISMYEGSGVTIPIFAIPQGCYIENYLNQQQQKQDSKRDEFIFAASGSLDEGMRKNQHILIEAFDKAFGGNKKVVLKVHMSNKGGSQQYEQFLQQCTPILNRASNIHISYGTLPEDEHMRFMQSCDCYVNISSGEGFSITPREALALGKPCIITNNTAQKTICASGYVRSVETPVPVPGVYVGFQKNIIGTRFSPTVEGVADALMDVYNNYAHWKNLAQQARPWVEQFCPEALIPKYVSLFKPKQILLGDKNEVTDDYLMTKSVVLYEKYRTVF